MADSATDAARARFEALRREFPWPDGVGGGEVFFERVRIAELPMFLAGFTAALPWGGQAVGSAAAPDGFPVERAYFELLERIALLRAQRSPAEIVLRDASGAALGRCAVAEVFPPDPQPELRRASLSNGVALQRTWPAVCEAACCELVERDRVLRSFGGGPTPRPVASDDAACRALAAEYDARAFAFDPDLPDLAYHARGVFLFPKAETAPLTYGFAAARDASRALAAAQREALQRLAFLWGEVLPERPPQPSPTPDYHQEYYLLPAHHALLREWLDGGRAKPGMQQTFDGAPVRFADLTPTPLERGGMRVARALSEVALALHFGGDDGAGRTPPHPVA